MAVVSYCTDNCAYDELTRYDAAQLQLPDSGPVTVLLRHSIYYLTLTGTVCQNERFYSDTFKT